MLGRGSVGNPPSPGSRPHSSNHEFQGASAGPSRCWHGSATVVELGHFGAARVEEGVGVAWNGGAASLPAGRGPPGRASPVPGLRLGPGVGPTVGTRVREVVGLVGRKTVGGPPPLGSRPHSTTARSLCQRQRDRLGDSHSGGGRRVVVPCRSRSGAPRRAGEGQGVGDRLGEALVGRA